MNVFKISKNKISFRKIMLSNWPAQLELLKPKTHVL